VDQKAGSVTAPARRTASAEWRNFVQLIQLTAGTNAGSAGDQQNNLALAHDAAYVGTKGINLLEITDRNQPLPGPGAIPPRRPLFLLSPDLTTNVGESVGNSNYHSLQLKARKRFLRGFYALGSYTLSKNIGDIDSTSRTPCRCR
jgi:hypothetical protein